jgi:hypothetical protein
MRQYFIFSGILLIRPIIDFDIAAPVPVQGQRQAGVDVVHTPGDAITMLGKRGEDLSMLFNIYEDHFAAPEESSAARPSSAKPVSDSDYELVDEHALPNPRPSTESGHESLEVHAPPSAQVFPTWFHPDYANYGLMGHAPQQNLGPSNSRPSTEFDPDDKSAVEEPTSRPPPQTELDADQENQVVHPPPPPPSPSPSPGSAWRTEFDDDFYMPDRRSENPQADSDVLKGNAKESLRISGTARDVLNVAQSKLQRERSLDPWE